MAMNSSAEIPKYIPDDIAEHLKTVLANQEMTLPEVFTSFKEMVDAFEEILKISKFPYNFQLVLTKSLAQNEALTNSLQKANALFYWKPDEKSFCKPWDLDTIRSALASIHNYGVTIIPEIPSKNIKTHLSKPESDIKNLEMNPVSRLVSAAEMLIYLLRR
jgi:hypothetical protein